MEEKLKRLQRLEEDRQQLEIEIRSQWERVLNTRKMISKTRKKFLLKTLENGKFVKMEVIEFGFDERGYTSVQFARFT